MPGDSCILHFPVLIIIIIIIIMHYVCVTTVFHRFVPPATGNFISLLAVGLHVADNRDHTCN